MQTCLRAFPIFSKTFEKMVITNMQNKFELEHVNNKQYNYIELLTPLSAEKIEPDTALTLTETSSIESSSSLCIEDS